MIDSFTQPRWIYKTVKDTRDCSCAELVLVIEDGSPPSQTRHGLPRTLFETRSHILRKLYIAVDAQLFKSRLDPFTLRRIRASDHDVRCAPDSAERSCSSIGPTTTEELRNQARAPSLNDPRKRTNPLSVLVVCLFRHEATVCCAPARWHAVRLMRTDLPAARARRW